MCALEVERPPRASANGRRMSAHPTIERVELNGYRPGSDSGGRGVSLRTRLLGTFGFVLLLMLGVGSWTAYQLAQQDQGYQALIRGVTFSAVYAEDLRATF